MGIQSNNDEKTLRAYKGPVGGVERKSERGADTWSFVATTPLHDAIVACARICAGLLVGVTKDGGNAAVTLFFDDQRMRFYPSDVTDLTDLLFDIVGWAGLDKPDIKFWQ